MTNSNSVALALEIYSACIGDEEIGTSTSLNGALQQIANSFELPIQALVTEEVYPAWRVCLNGKMIAFIHVV